MQHTDVYGEIKDRRQRPVISGLQLKRKWSELASPRRDSKRFSTHPLDSHGADQ
jgi:hypothetical protein